MSEPTLAVCLFGYRLNQILYPWRESIESALALADAVYFCECYGEDGVWEDAQEIAAREHRFHLIRHPWGDHYSIQAVLGNLLMDEIGTQYDFALKLDADEVLGEWSFKDFRTDLVIMLGRNYALGCPHYTHLCPDDKHEFDFIYRSKAVLCDTHAHLRFDLGYGGDACALGGAKEYQTRLEILHFGKMSMGREKEALQKEYDFQQLYVELGFPDPIVVEQRNKLGYIDYEAIFHLAKEAGQFREYHGRYPVFVEKYLDQARKRHQEWKNGQSILS